MTERAAHLVDAVLPWVPVRQWVLSLPYRLRYLLAWDHGLSRAVLTVYARRLLECYRRDARRRGIAGGRTGTVTVIQRFASGLNLNVHFHTLVLDGVFTDTPQGLGFHPAPPPSDADVAQVLARVQRAVQRLLVRRGLHPAPDDGPRDPLVEVSPVLAGVVGASVHGRIALGPRAGSRVRRLGREDPTGVGARGPRQAHREGFDLHANLWVSARDRAGLERLCRYLLRPPLAQHRLRLRGDGHVVVELKRAWHDGTTALVFEPTELLEKLAALIPRPEINLTLYHGLLAPNARWRPRVVRDGRPATEEAEASTSAEGGAPLSSAVPPRPRYWSWAALMARAFALDVLACPRCGGRLRLLATIVDPAVIARVLAGRPPSHGPAPAGPGPPSPESTSVT